jgi:iduronate 2-sulfatase
MVFISANGGFGVRMILPTNDLTDDATRVPFIISMPSMSKAGQKSAALVETVDVYPTLTALCGIAAPDYLQGTSMAPLLQAPNRVWKEAVFGRYPRSRNKFMGYSVRTARYRYNQYIEVATGKILDSELYDVVNDPLGYKNLVDKKDNEQLAVKLKDMLEKGWRHISIPK